MKHANELAAITAQKKVELLEASIENAKSWVINCLSSKLEDAAKQGKRTLTTPYPVDINLPTAIIILETYGFKVKGSLATINISW